MGAANELREMYRGETSANVKRTIIESMFVGGNVDMLLELARGEADPNLRAAAVRTLGLLGRERTGATLVQMYRGDSNANVRPNALSVTGPLIVIADRTNKSKVKVDGGNEITVAGCMERNPAGGYMLTDGSTRYSLVGGKGLDKHVGHRIEVRGKTTDGGHGKVKIETKTKSSRSETTEEKAEIKGDVHAIGVKSVKMVASSCT